MLYEQMNTGQGFLYHAYAWPPDPTKDDRGFTNPYAAEPGETFARRIEIARLIGLRNEHHYCVRRKSTLAVVCDFVYHARHASMSY